MVPLQFSEIGTAQVPVVEPVASGVNTPGDVQLLTDVLGVTQLSVLLFALAADSM
jgi:hypothetical protein